MSDEQGSQPTEAAAELEREILEGRKFTLEEAIARMVGPGAMKGESPVARMRQAEMEIESWLESHLADSGGFLRMVLHREVKSSDLLLNNFEQPLVVLASHCQRVIESNYLLEELVREVDVQWGRVMGERPHFEKGGSTPDPDDAYTIASVRKVLLEIVRQLSVTAN